MKAFDWLEYLELAKVLADMKGVESFQEAARRSAVSRAYFAAFCWARNYAGTKGGFKPRRDATVHKELRDYLANQGRRDIASALNRLRMWRNICDYEDEVSELDNLVSASLYEAKNIIEKMG
jgi:uncharacterized protein (UPF0332 family)